MSAPVIVLKGHQPRPSQTDRVIALLLSRKGQRVAAPEVARVGGRQYAARIFSAREMGYTILNSTKRVDDQVKGEYMLTAYPGETPSLFSEVAG